MMAQLGTMPPCNFKPQPYTGSSYEQVLKDREYAPPFYATYYKEPLYLTDGYMQYLFDHKGERYLDLFSGVATVSCGHSHPLVVKAVKDQADRLMHTSSLYLNEWYG